MFCRTKISELKVGKIKLAELEIVYKWKMDWKDQCRVNIRLRYSILSHLRITLREEILAVSLKIHQNFFPTNFDFFPEQPKLIVLVVLFLSIVIQ